MKKQTEEDGWQGFLKRCQAIHSIEQLNAFFALFLTPSERQEVAGRFLIVRELLKGEKTQREIARELEVSVANVSRGSNALKNIEADLKRFLEP